jgi:hypothetical protein
MANSTCCYKKSICRFLSAFVLVFMGSLLLAGWEGWFRYSKFSSDKYHISVVLEDGRKVTLEAGQQLRVLKTTNRVDIESADESSRTLIFNPKEVTIQPK